MNDKELVKQIDQLKYKLKISDNKTEMLNDLNNLLNDFIRKWELDLDPHIFAKLPEEVEENEHFGWRAYL